MLTLKSIIPPANERGVVHQLVLPALRMIVKTIIDLGRGLNMNLVAKGVESEA